MYCEIFHDSYFKYILKLRRKYCYKIIINHVKTTSFLENGSVASLYVFYELLEFPVLGNCISSLSISFLSLTTTLVRKANFPVAFVCKSVIIFLNFPSYLTNASVYLKRQPKRLLRNIMRKLASM